MSTTLILTSGQMTKRNKLFHYIAEKFLDKELTDQDVSIVSISLKEVPLTI